jgi:broad specificity phosphatase PhoE
MVADSSERAPSAPPADTRLLLVRHGESNATVERILGGELSDTGLSELGRRQSRALHDRFEEEPARVDIVVSSTLDRALETAQIVSPALGVSEIHEDPELVERRPGEADGMAFDEYLKEYGSGIWSDPYLELSPGGESEAQFHARAVEALSTLITRYIGMTVIVFCHGGVIDVAFRAFLDLPRYGGFDLWTVNTSITEMLRVNGREPPRWRLVRYNDAAHLAGLPRKTVK